MTIQGNFHCKDTLFRKRIGRKTQTSKKSTHSVTSHLELLQRFFVRRTPHILAAMACAWESKSYWSDFESQKCLWESFRSAIWDVCSCLSTSKSPINMWEYIMTQKPLQVGWNSLAFRLSARKTKASFTFLLAACYGSRTTSVPKAFAQTACVFSLSTFHTFQPKRTKTASWPMSY